MVKKGDDGKPTPQEKDESILPSGYNPKQVKDGVKVLFEVIEKTSPKTSLFADEGEFICIQVTCIRVPTIRKQHYRIVLPNRFLKDTSEVCLFVKNLSGNKDREIEESVRHFKEKLAEAGVSCINEIITVNQLMQEYKTYEMKRRLAARFDIFLADSSVSNWLHGALGKTFHRCRKQPTPVHLNYKNMKENIERALCKTTLTITGKGAQCMAKVGHTKQSVEQVYQNVEAFVKELKNIFPGKWGNVRSLHIRTDSSFSVPLYYTFAFPNTVGVPKQPKTFGKLIKTEKGDLSTLPDGYEVIVLPDGNVKVKGKKPNGNIGWLNDQELKHLGALEPLDEEEMEEGDELKSDSEDEGNVENVKEMSETTSTDTEDEEAGMEAAEDAYLKELSMEKLKQDKKRKARESQIESPVKKPRKIPKLKKNVSNNWIVEAIDDGNDPIGKINKNVKNKSPKTGDDLPQAGNPIVNPPLSGNEKLNKKLASKNSKVSIDRKTEDLKVVSLNNGIKEKVSGNKLGKTKKKMNKI